MKSNFQVKKISNYDAGYPENSRYKNTPVLKKIPIKLFSIFVIGFMFLLTAPGCHILFPGWGVDGGIDIWDDYSSCYEDSDCYEGEHCVHGRCREKMPDEEVVDIDEGCAVDNNGKSCHTDNDCGNCMICVYGKCSRGCQDDNDCQVFQMYEGLKCNKELARCLNVFASEQACNETNCPTGCCYAEKGLQGLHCLDKPTLEVCGLCPQGEVYDGEKCIQAVCSTTTPRSCSRLNAHEAHPACWECKSEEFICTLKPDCPEEEDPDHYEVNDHEYFDDFETEDFETDDFETDDFETGDFETGDFETEDFETDDD